MTGLRARELSFFSLIVFLVFAVGTGMSACGSDKTGSGCKSDGDCSGGKVCQDGQCTIVDNWGLDAGADGEETGDGETGSETGIPGCFSVQNKCVREVCEEDSDVCTTEECTVECDPWEKAVGCQCQPKDCRDVDDCDGYACVEEKCTRCKKDSECEMNQTCNPNGKCLEGQPCTDDMDCPARKRCSENGDCIDRDECIIDDDCEEKEICFNGQCTFSPDCKSDKDCRDGMECIGNKCYEKVCRGHEDCEGDKLCDAGECIAPPSADKCFVATSDGKIAENQRIKLEALAVDSNGNGVSARFDWSSSNPAVAKIASSGKYAVGGSSSGKTEITASIKNGGKKCSGKVELVNLGKVNKKKLRVVVTNAKSGKAVSGADIVLDGGKTAKTNASGVATLARPSGSYTVSVFHPKFNYLTVKGLNSADIRLPVREKSGEGPVAGFTGKFDKSKLHTMGDVTLGLAGTSITGGMLEIGLDQLLGEPFVRTVQTPMGSQQVPLPAGLVAHGQVLGFNLDIKKNYYATGPGGPRLSWGLAGEVSGQRLFQLFQGGSNPLAVLLPLFNRFDHATKPLQLKEKPRVTDSQDFDGDGDSMEKLPDYMNFPKVNLQPSVRQNLVTEVTVSNFPKLPGGNAEFAALVGGNLLQSPGFVPLGISATTDEDDDGFPDLRRLSLAPPHGSIAGGRFAIIALAFRTDGLNPQSGLELPDNMSAALWTQQKLPKKVGLGTFPDATKAKVDAMKREVTLDADAGPIYRFQFVGKTRTWEVWTMGPKGTMGNYKHTAKIPQMPGMRTDLFAKGQKSLVDAIQVSVTVDDLVKATGVGLRDIGLVATAFNRTKFK